MTVEEFKELIQNPEAAKDLIPILKAAGFETPEDIQGLKAKNNEILLKMKKINEEKANLQKLIDDADYQEYLAKKDNPDNSVNNATQGTGNAEFDKAKLEIRKLTSELKKLSEEKAKVEEKANQVESIFVKDRKSAQLSAALDAAGFDPKHKSLLINAMQGIAKVDPENNYNVIIEDENGLPMPAKEYAIAYANTETGKEYLRKPENKGANSQGFNGGSASGKVMQISAYNSMNPKDQAAFMKSGGSLKD